MTGRSSVSFQKLVYSAQNGRTDHISLRTSRQRTFPMIQVHRRGANTFNRGPTVPAKQEDSPQAVYPPFFPTCVPLPPAALLCTRAGVHTRCAVRAHEGACARASAVLQALFLPAWEQRKNFEEQHWNSVGAGSDQRDTRGGGDQR